MHKLKILPDYFDAVINGKKDLEIRKMEYDFQAIKKYIEYRKDEIDSVFVGMIEDWGWTAEEVYNEGKALVDFDDDSLDIAGIRSSSWATPTMIVTLKNGGEVIKDCYKGGQIMPRIINPKGIPPEREGDVS